MSRWRYDNKRDRYFTPAEGYRYQIWIFKDIQDDPMITRYLLFEDVMSIDIARDEFKKYNPSLNIDEWEFMAVSVSFNGYKVTATPKNGKSFFVVSPAHFLKWANHI